MSDPYHMERRQHYRPCGICGERVPWGEGIGGAYQMQYHDCKPVPGAKLDAAIDEIARLRADLAEAQRQLALPVAPSRFIDINGDILTIGEFLDEVRKSLRERAEAVKLLWSASSDADSSHYRAVSRDTLAEIDTFLARVGREE